jgi:glycosyltransferase involved in cell wall biosynthesis
MCRGFQALGGESMAVMPGARMAGDSPELIRTDYANLESVDWWKALELDGLVLYAWGSPRYRKIARAIHNAGIFLVLNQDNGGLVSPLSGWRGWLKEQRVISGGGIAHVKAVLKGLVGLLVIDPRRAWHLQQGNVIACVSPEAARHYRKLCFTYGGVALRDRIRVVPHPIEMEYTYDGDAKKAQIVCVGRWQERVQKRPKLMCEVVRRILEKEQMISFHIVGTCTPELEQWHRSLVPEMRIRVNLLGQLDRETLLALLRESTIFYSPSAFESFGIAAGEALCCGCSVVAGQSPSMASFEWFVQDQSGRLATDDTASGHATALLKEMNSWVRSARNAHKISAIWGDRLHADKVAAAVLKLAISE